MKKLIIKYGICFLGSVILGIGVGVNSRAMLGTDAFTVLLSGMTNTLRVSLSIANIIVNVIQLVFSFVVYKKTISYATLFAMFFSSIGIELALLLPVMTVLPFQILSLILGTLLYAFGIALTIYPQLGYTPYDAVIFSVQHHYPYSYAQIRWINDALFLAIGFALGGSFGLGTIFILVTVGKIVEYFLKQLNRFKW